MFGLEPQPFGAVDVIESGSQQVAAPAVAAVHNVMRVVPSGIDRFGIDRRNGRFRTAAGFLQFQSRCAKPSCSQWKAWGVSPRRVSAP